MHAEELLAAIAAAFGGHMSAVEERWAFAGLTVPAIPAVASDGMMDILCMQGGFLAAIAAATHEPVCLWWMSFVIC